MLPPVETLARNFVLPPERTDHWVGKHQTRQEHFHGLTVGELGLLLASDKLVIEIVDSLPLCRLPNAPAWLHAMANQRGNIIPIYDLALLLDQPRAMAKRQHFLIIIQDQDQFGIVIDQLPEKIALLSDDFTEDTPPLPSGLAPFVNAVRQKNDRMWLEWEPLRFIEAITAAT